MRKEALIFGSSGALGGGVVKTLLKGEFDHLYFFDMHMPEDELPAVTKVVTGDLSDSANVKKAFEFVDPSEDKLLFLFSTVGGFVGSKMIEETTDQDLQKMFSMNFTSNFNILREFKQKVAKCAGGSAIFTSAYTAFAGEAGKSVYGASKSALSHLVETGSEEGRAINLSVNGIAPFIIDTPANRSWMTETNFDTLIKPEEVGNLLLSVFRNFNFVSGNIIKLPYRFPVNFNPQK
ncbi:MAG: SDR family oxidoreductase [Ignavibacteria bacterium]|nr:SDR family oxidoreductase [Ignavibacteria bacterium]